jgi:dUTP pyrophosphatase
MITNSNDDDVRSIEESLRQLHQVLSAMPDEKMDIDYDIIKQEFGIDLDEMEREIMDYQQKLKLKYVLMHQDAVSPKYNYGTDSGFDLHSVEDIEIPPFGRRLVPTGLRFDIPKNMEMQVRTKSGLAINQGLMVLNSPGTVDNGYTGEVKVIVFNTNPHEVVISKGMKIAQAVLCPVLIGSSVELESVDIIEEKDRNANGFGSTGL